MPIFWSRGDCVPDDMIPCFESAWFLFFTYTLFVFLDFFISPFVAFLAVKFIFVLAGLCRFSTVFVLNLLGFLSLLFELIKLWLLIGFDSIINEQLGFKKDFLAVYWSLGTALNCLFCFLWRVLMKLLLDFLCSSTSIWGLVSTGISLSIELVLKILYLFNGCMSSFDAAFFGISELVALWRQFLFDSDISLLLAGPNSFRRF